MKSLFKKIISLSLTGALCIGVMFSTSACGGKDSGSGKGLKVLYTTSTLDDFKILLQDAVNEAASAEGVSLELGDPCASVDEQVAQIKEAAEADYDAIICQAVDRTTALQLEVSAGDTPIIFVNVQPDEEYLKKDQYMVVGSKETDAGAYQAEYVWEALGKPKSFNAVMMRGEDGHNATEERSVSVKEYYKENGVDVNFVFYDNANWGTDTAASMFEVFLKTGQEFDAVFCNNDSMALGVVEVMEEEKYDFDEIPVVGVDATTDGCQSIADGKMQFTVFQSAKGQGEISIKTAIALATKGTAKDVEGVTEDGMYVWVPYEPVDSSNVKDYQ